MVQESDLENVSICVVGLGYVGLPLALAFGRTNVTTWGLDINEQLVEDLKNGIDRSKELTKEEITSSSLKYSTDPAVISESNFIIIAVPTPVNAANQPDLYLVEMASEMVGKHMSKGTTVVYESTVYPGVTEDICGPILEKSSGFVCGVDFKLGYSPERINPGDKEHTLQKIVKVVSGMDEESSALVAAVYKTVCTAGVFQAANIKTAEAAKVIENTQRDINIALMNELSIIFHRIGIDTRDVLAAAGTKWNFLKFYPGLVGGHCIGVDPYYLVYKAQEVGYQAEVITAGRRVNDSMPLRIYQELIDVLIRNKKGDIQNTEVVVAGLTFKENVRDLRNSKIKGTIKQFQSVGIKVVGFDPLLQDDEVREEFALQRVESIPASCDVLIIAAPHDEMKEHIFTFLRSSKSDLVVYDIKGTFSDLDYAEGVTYISL